MGEFRGKNTESILFFAWPSLTHTLLLSTLYQARAIIISPTSTLIYLSDSFAGEHDSSRGGINHLAGPNSVRKTPTTYRKQNFSTCIRRLRISYFDVVPRDK